MQIVININKPKKLIKKYNNAKLSFAKLLSKAGAKLENTAQKLAKGAK